jgi:hypothetical protein
VYIQYTHFEGLQMKYPDNTLMNAINKSIEANNDYFFDHPEKTGVDTLLKTFDSSIVYV